MVINNIISQLDNYYKNLDRLQLTCKHIKTETIHNIGSYKLRVKCIDCGKILKFKFNNK